jgi:hypothetical protein
MNVVINGGVKMTDAGEEGKQQAKGVGQKKFVAAPDKMIYKRKQ